MSLTNVGTAPTSILMVSLLFRNLIFTLLAPGVVAGLIPYLLVKDDIENIKGSWASNEVIGIIVFLLGLVILLHCIYLFAVVGKGTLLPIDPTKRLVTVGLYNYSRNPMYLGVITILIGEGVFTWSYSLWIYTFIVFFFFNIFIFIIEEPRLRTDFGEEYDGYRKKVRMWI